MNWWPFGKLLFMSASADQTNVPVSEELFAPLTSGVEICYQTFGNPEQIGASSSPEMITSDDSGSAERLDMPSSVPNPV